MELSRASLRSAFFSSRESTSQRYDCSRTAGPRYSSWFHQYEGHDVEQQAHRMHSYSPSSFRRSSLLCRYSLPCVESASEAPRVTDGRGGRRLVVASRRLEGRGC